MAAGAGRLRRSPFQHCVMFAERLIIKIHHRHRAPVTSVYARVQRTQAKRALPDGNILPLFFPGDEGLAIAAVYPGAVVREVLAQGVRLCAFTADDSPAGPRHGKIRVVTQTMDFDDVSEHFV